MSPTPDKENVLLTLNQDVFSLVLKVWPYQWMKVETFSNFKHQNHLQFLIPELLVPSNSLYDERHWSFVKSISRKRILLKEVLHIWALQISSKFPLTYPSKKTKTTFFGLPNTHKMICALGPSINDVYQKGEGGYKKWQFGALCPGFMESLTCFTS